LLSNARLSNVDKVAVFERCADQLLAKEFSSFPLIVEEIVKLYVGQLNGKKLTQNETGGLLFLLYRQNGKLPDQILSKVHVWFLAGQAICFGQPTPISPQFQQKE